MSLINQMLADLEHRRGGQALGAERVLDGVYAASPALAPLLDARAALRLALAIVLGIVAACAAWYGLHALEQMEDGKATPAFVPVAPPPIAAMDSAARALSGWSPPVGPEAESHEEIVDRVIAAVALAPGVQARPSAHAPVDATPDVAADVMTSTPPLTRGDGTADPAAPAAMESSVAEVPAVPAPESSTGPVIVTQPATDLGAAAVEGAAVEQRGTVHRQVVEVSSDPVRQLTEILARLRRDGGREVRTELAQFVDRNPQMLLAREALATDLIRAGERLAAEETLRAGLVLAPGAHRYALMLAHLEVERGAIQAAHDTLVSAEPGGGARGEYLAFLAALKQRLLRHGEAIAAYRQALEQAPERGAWWVGLGISLMADEQREAAGQAFQRALVDHDLSDNLRRYAERELDRLTGRG